MENVSNGQHRGPTPHVIIKPEALAREKAARGKNGKKGDLTAAQRLKKKRAHAAYYAANRERLLAAQRRYDSKKHKDKNLPVVSDEGDGKKPAMPKRPSKVDALVCIQRSLVFLRQGDADGAELWSRFAARIIEGKE